jgi:hypothetical protein
LSQLALSPHATYEHTAEQNNHTYNSVKSWLRFMYVSLYFNVIFRVVLLVPVVQGLAWASLGSPWWGPPVEISISAAGTDWPKYKRFIQFFLNDGHVTDPPD